MRYALGQKFIPAAVLIALSVSVMTSSLSVRAWESVDPSQETTEEITEDAGEEAGEDSSRLIQEKTYLLQALEQLEVWGLTPVAIWSALSNDDTVQEMISAVSGTVSETVSDTVTSAQNSELAEMTQELVGEVGEQVSEAVEEQSEKARKSLLEFIREKINSFLDQIF